ncbi:MAG TPA: ferredoxin [Sphaerochaeta sp.]|jgi:ferredoxin|nr:ferredoxin [Sphaerochaeta sp.]
MKATVDRDECIGCELCVTLSPEVFEMDDTQIAKVIADPVPSDAEDTAKDAQENCPTGAISIED